MMNLLYKELRLAVHPTFYVFMFMGALVLIPAYPYGVVFMFGCLAPYITCQFGRETRDTYYSALLPIKKSDVVLGKCLMAAFMQLSQLLLSIPFAFLRLLILPSGNVVGIEANVAYYGFGLIIYGMFDLIFFTKFYKTAFKVGVAFLLGAIPMTLGIIFMEALPHFPALTWLDSTGPDMLPRQWPILAAGLVFYPLALFTACRLSAKRFAQVDL